MHKSSFKIMLAPKIRFLWLFNYSWKYVKESVRNSPDGWAIMFLVIYLFLNWIRT